MLILDVTKSTDKKNFTKIGNAFEPWDAEQIVKNDILKLDPSAKNLSFTRKNIKAKDGNSHNVKSLTYNNVEYRIWDYAAKDI